MYCVLLLKLTIRLQVLPLSKFLLLQTAAPDAIVRLKNTAMEQRKEIEEIYFKQQHHHSIVDFMMDQLRRCEAKDGLLIQVMAMNRDMYVYTY